MNCQDRELRELLVEFELGRLTDVQEDQVRKHLASCSDCQSDLRFIKALRKDLVELKRIETRKHPTVDELVAYVESPLSLEQSRKSQLRQHLIFCANCRAEYDHLSELESAIAQTGEHTSLNSEAAGRSVQNRLSSLIWHPITASAIAAGIGLIFFFAGVLKSPQDEKSWSVPLQRIEQQMRATNVMSKVYRSPEDRRIGLEFAPPAGQFAGLRLILLDSSGTEVSKSNLPGRFSNGMRGEIFLNSKGLADGPFRLSVDGTELGTQRVVKAVYEFELVTRR